MTDKIKKLEETLKKEKEMQKEAMALVNSARENLLIARIRVNVGMEQPNVIEEYESLVNSAILILGRVTESILKTEELIRELRADC